MAPAGEPVGLFGLIAFIFGVSELTGDELKVGAPLRALEGVVALLQSDPDLVELSLGEAQAKDRLGGELVTGRATSLATDVHEELESLERVHHQCVDLADADALAHAVGEQQDRCLRRRHQDDDDHLVRALLRVVAELELSHAFDEWTDVLHGEYPPSTN